MTLSAMHGYRKVRLPEEPVPKPGAGFARGIRKPLRAKPGISTNLKITNS